MHATVRPYATAGVALVGAGVIAVGTTAPPLPDIHFPGLGLARHASVELAALVDPITAYTQLFTNTFANLSALGGEILANPTPILQRIATNTAGNATILSDALFGPSGVAGTLASLFDPTNPSGVPALLQAAGAALSTGDVATAVENQKQLVVSAVPRSRRSLLD